jgi:chemotaxis methyl-accepting protein methylase
MAGVASDLRCILEHMSAQTKQDFSAYRVDFLRARVERRMRLQQIDDADTYARFLQQTRGEVEALRREWRLGTTSFFRDPEELAAAVCALAPLVDGRPEDGVLRAWVPGCATGEEAYSLAIALGESLERPVALRVFATDLDRAALAVARAGWYTEAMSCEIEPERLERWFDREHRAHRVKRPLRDRVLFAGHDVARDAAFGWLDLICCRNLLRYLTDDVQRRALALFSSALSPGGLLLLGAHERGADWSELFEPVDETRGLLRRRELPLDRQPSLPWRGGVRFARSRRTGDPDDAERAPRSAPGGGTVADEIAGLRDALQATAEHVHTTAHLLRTVGTAHVAAARTHLELANADLVAMSDAFRRADAALASEVEGLAQAQTDLANVLGAVAVPFVILDDSLRVQRFSSDLQRFFPRFESRIGQPLHRLELQLDYPDLPEDAEQVLRTLIPAEREVRGSGGSWWRVRIAPYRTVRHAVVGAVLTFCDVTGAREAAERARADQRAFESVVDTIREPLLVLDGELRVLRASPSFYRLLKLEPERVQDRSLWALDGGQSAVAELLRVLGDGMPMDGSHGDYRAECDFGSMGRRRVVLRARRLDGNGALDRLLLSIEDGPEERSDSGEELETQ